MKKHLLLGILIAASLITHFIFFGHPRETVFDEVHFGKFISGYFTHEYFFDIHPPLAKLIISGMGYLTSFKPGFSFAEIGQKFPDSHYLWLRLLPTLAGAALPVIIYFLVLEMGMSKIAAFSAGILLALENGSIVQSRFILLDAFLLLFGFSALLLYFVYRRRKDLRYLLMSSILATLSLSVKWTGATFLVIIGILYLEESLKSKQIKKLLTKGGAIFVALPLVLYFSIFALHFSLLNKSGPGDPFMSPEFRKTLVGSYDSTRKEIKSLNIFEKFYELNVEMYKANAGLTAGHPYSSKWYTWPFMIRPIYYWNEPGQVFSAKEPSSSRIYFLGNPIVWWASTLAILYLIQMVLYEIFNKIKPKKETLLLTGAYFFNMLPFLGIKRALFLYHYLIGLTLAIIALVYLVDHMPNKKRIFGILILASFIAFVFFAPLSYGLPLTEKAYNLRNWLKTWI